MMTKLQTAVMLLATGLMAMAVTAQAATLSLGQWQLVTDPSNYTGGVGTTLTPGADTSSVSVSNNGPDGFTTGTGFFTTFDPYTLGSTFGVSERIRVSFDLELDTTGDYANNVFRFGLFNHNGTMPETNAHNWLGYMVHAAGASGSQGELMSRESANANPYASGTGAVSLDRTTTVDPTDFLRSGTYSVQMDIALVSPTEVDLSVSIIGEDIDQNPYEWVSGLQSFHTFQPGQTTFDRLGFQLTGAAGGVTNVATLSNVTVSVVPEPATLGLSVLSVAGLAMVARRRGWC